MRESNTPAQEGCLARPKGRDDGDDLDQVESPVQRLYAAVMKAVGRLGGA